MPAGRPRKYRPLDIRTPGAALAAPAIQAAVDQRDAALDASAAAALADTSDVVVAPPASLGAAPDLKAYIDAQIAKGVAAGVKAIRASQSGPVPAVELPDQSQVNPALIKELTLSKQGYVVPRNYGAAPEHIRAQVLLGQPH